MTEQREMIKSYAENNIRTLDVVDVELANFIRDNMSHIYDNEELMFNVAKKIISKEKLLKEIMTYEFLHSTPSENDITDLNRLVDFSLEKLKKYQGIVGGDNIEDKDWIKINLGEKSRFKIDDSPFIYNSISEDSHNDELILFLDNFVTYVNKRSSNINVRKKIIFDDPNEIYWILIIFDESF